MPPFSPDPNQFYAHTSTLADGKTSNPDKTTWEPLFTPWHDLPARHSLARRLGPVDDPDAVGGHDLPTDPQIACSGKNGTPCPHCANLEPQHGHLNKVAHLTAKLAAEMFPEGPDRESARQWGYLAGLWHDLGKFSLGSFTF